MRSKNVFLNIISNIASQLIIIIYGFVVPKIIITKFGSDVNGLISSITQFLGYIALLQSGFGPVIKSLLYKPIAKKNGKEIANILRVSDKFFKKIAKIFIVYIGVLSILYPLIINGQFSYFFTFSLIIIISFSIFAEYFFGMTYRLYLQAEQKNYIISTINSISYIASLVIIVILSFLNVNIHIIKLASGLIFVIKPLIQNYYVKKKYNITFDAVDDNYVIKQKWDGLAQHIASVVHDNTDITLLTIFKPLSEVSVYAVYYMIVKAINSLMESFCTGIDSTFGDMIAKGETSTLNKKFGMYEIFYFMISTVIFSCAIVLITPFVSVYTKGIHDANYIRFLFGYLIVIAIYIRCIREAYHGVIKAAGHFKETRKGAWIECASNLLISVLLVNRYGIVGVAIGTIVAMTIRTIEFVYHSNKYILKRSIMESVKKIIILLIETCIIVFFAKYFVFMEYNSYINWIINAIILSSFAVAIVLLFSIIIYRKELKELLDILKNMYLKKSERNKALD